MNPETQKVPYKQICEENKEKDRRTEEIKTHVLFALPKVEKLGTNPDFSDSIFIKL